MYCVYYNIGTTEKLSDFCLFLKADKNLPYIWGKF